jgi:hypothetical protein
VKLLDDAAFHLNFNRAMVAVWIILLPPTLIWWRESVMYLVLLSWWANFASHLAGWMAAKAEREAEKSGS